MNPTPPVDPPRSRLHRLLAALRQPALLIALLATAIAASLWLESRSEIEQFRSDQARRLAEGDAVASEARALAKQAQETLAGVQARVALLEARQEQAQSQQLALESLYQELSRTRDERLLAEIEQSLAIASQQLQIAGNVEAALIALQDADNRLLRAAQPQFMGVRRSIAADINRLRAQPGSDLSGAALKLDGVVAAIDGMPFAFEKRPRPNSAGKNVARPAQGYWQGLLDDLWGELRDLIRIQRVDQADPGLLAPTQAFFLRENLKLRLINARLSLLARDAPAFHEDMRQAQSWLEKFFDTQARPVRSAIDTLKNLDRFDLAQDLPNLTSTLTALRNIRLARGRN